MSRPKKPFTQENYCQYLMSSQKNYTLTNYAEHVENVSHDLVKLFLERERLSGRNLWKQIRDKLVQSEHGYIIFDDTVLDKSYSKKIDSVRWQYSGNTHSVIRGIGLLNCIYVNPETEQFWVIDYRIFDPDKDGKTKVQHVMDMLINSVYHKKISFKTILVDSWYANYKLMLFIHHLDKLFYCPLKKNRLIRPLDSNEKYRPVSELDWDNDALKQGQLVQLKSMPKAIPLKLFSISISTNRIDFVVTNDTNQSCSDDTKKVCGIRWCIEQFHREIKQVTGIEKCQCRKQRIQRNHIACAIQAWIFLKDLSYKTKKTIYQIKNTLMRNYLIQELDKPSIKFSFS